MQELDHGRFGFGGSLPRNASRLLPGQLVASVTTRVVGHDCELVAVMNPPFTGDTLNALPFSGHSQQDPHHAQT